MKKLFGAIALVVCSIQSAHATIISITSMDVRSAHVDGDFLPPSGFDLNPTATTNLVGGYIAEITSTSIGPAGVQTLYTSDFNNDTNGLGPAAGTIASSAPIPSGVIDTVLGTITVDLTSLFADHGPMDQLIGAIATGTVNYLTGFYTMSWTRTIAQGTATFTFSGRAIPEPGTLFLLSGGLLLMARAKKSHTN